MSRLAEDVECSSVAQANSRSKRRGDRGIVFGSRPTVKDTSVIVKETWESLPSVTIMNCWLKASSTYLSAASLHFLKNKVEGANEETKKPGKEVAMMQLQYLRLRRACIKAANGSSIPDVVIEDVAQATHPDVSKKKLQSMMSWWGTCEDDVAFEIAAIEQADE